MKVLKLEAASRAMIKLIVLTFDETMRRVWEDLSHSCPTLVMKKEVPTYTPEKEKKLVDKKISLKKGIDRPDD